MNRKRITTFEWIERGVQLLLVVLILGALAQVASLDIEPISHYAVVLLVAVAIGAGVAFVLYVSTDRGVL